MTTYELSGKFVGDGAIASRGGRIFVAFKKPGEQRNTLFEYTPGAAVPLRTIGLTPGAYYKDGNCALAFDDASGELLMFNTCSPNPSTGGDARPVLWKTGTVVAGAGGGTVDATARTQLAQLITNLHKV